MPAYAYSEIDGNGDYVKGGRVILRFHSMRDSLPEFVEENGSRFRRDLLAEGPKGGHSQKWATGCELYALGVNPVDAPQLSKELAKSGLRTEINSRGNPVVYSGEERRKVCEALNYHDNQSYGGRHDARPLSQRSR